MNTQIQITKIQSSKEVSMPELVLFDGDYASCGGKLIRNAQTRRVARNRDHPRPRACFQGPPPAGSDGVSSYGLSLQGPGGELQLRRAMEGFREGEA